jgi:hypothetical protein
VQISPQQAAARLRSTAELLAQMNHENRNTLQRANLTDLTPTNYVEYREINDALAQLEHRCLGLAEALTLPEPEGQA